MFVNVNAASASSPSLARQPIHATQEMLDVAAHNVSLAKQWSRTIVATATQHESSFDQKLKKAVGERRAMRSLCAITVKEKEARDERERSRYRPVQRRARTKGE
jgi:hypothetical protein